MRPAQASALVAVTLLFASCGGNGADSTEPTWTAGEVIKAAGLKRTASGYVHPRSGCKVSAILTSRDEVQERAAAGHPVANNLDGSAGVVVDESPRRQSHLTACLLVMKRELRPLRPRPPGSAS